MSLPFTLISLVLLASAAVALSLRNLIHSALLLVVSWFALAAFYLWAGAEFAAFAQVLVYVGAISMIVLFAVLLTKRAREEVAVALESRRRAILAGITSAAVAGVFSYAIFHSSLSCSVSAGPGLSVRELGTELMGAQSPALLIVGLILTVALIGAVVIAAQPSKSDEENKP